MSLDLYMYRCQGRLGRALGAATLVGECIDCKRRTDIPADASLTWMQPPVKAHPALECPSRIGPEHGVAE